MSGRQDELDGLLELIRFNGMYPWLGSQADIVRYREDEEARDALFEEVMVSELGRWVALGDSRLADRAPVRTSWPATTTRGAVTLSSRLLT